MSFKLKPDIVLTDTEYGWVLLDERTGAYWGLNPTGKLVLEKLLDGGTPDDASRALAEKFQLDLEVAATDATELVAGLRTAGLISS